MGLFWMITHLLIVVLQLVLIGIERHKTNLLKQYIEQNNGIINVLKAEADLLRSKVSKDVKS